MTLREVTRTVISLVEKASGCQVVVNEDRSLKTLAAARIARGANKIHQISYNPSAVSEPDYLICFQEGRRGQGRSVWGRTRVSLGNRGIFIPEEGVVRA